MNRIARDFQDTRINIGTDGPTDTPSTGLITSITDRDNEWPGKRCFYT